MGEAPRFVRFASGSDKPSLADRLREWRSMPEERRGSPPVKEGPPLNSGDIEEGNGAEAAKPFRTH